LTIKGGIYIADGAVSNFFEYAAENSNSGIYTPSITGMIIYCGRYNDAIWNPISVSTHKEWEREGKRDG
jgi:hypothetical protein